jgi:hypothetical protein
LCVLDRGDALGIYFSILCVLGTSVAPRGFALASFSSGFASMKPDSGKMIA